MRPAVFFRLRLRLRLQNTADLPTLILSLNLEHKWGGGHGLRHSDASLCETFGSYLAKSKPYLLSRLFHCSNNFTDDVTFKGTIAIGNFIYYPRHIFTLYIIPLLPMPTYVM